MCALHGCGLLNCAMIFVVTGIAAAGGDFRTHSRALVKACKDGSIQHYDG